MPQMFPLYWLDQYIYFLSLYYIVTMLIFQLKTPTSIKMIESNFKMFIKTKKMNWKW
uniref:ATP synthase F0 subunit 8 n=1 Tax=Leptocimbex praiaformis TaxID=2819030 RepID=A0A8A3SPC4_9HYME|nr:ATP synthase F0 subunit 8 [Leptocimbex praiaformis]